jgi:hypothetical protein
LLNELVVRDVESEEEEEVYPLPFVFSPKLNSFPSGDFLFSVFGPGRLSLSGAWW